MNGTARVISPDTDSDWWARFSQDLIAYEYVPSNNAHGLQAPNRAHNLRTYFEPGGIRVHDRTTADSPTLASLSVAGLGRGTALAPVSPGIVRQQADRVEIVRPGLVEWYENSAQGLEQGFTLPERPQGKGSLVLTLAVADATASLKGQSVELTSDEGRRLRYNKLKAIDADGQTLFSRLVVPSPDRVYLVVNDIGAKYPLVIDPLLTAIPDTLLESNQPGSSGIKPSAFGRSVSGAGDVNGDGFADVIVGAWGWDGGENEEGAVFVFLGSATGIVGSNPADAHAQIESNQAGARLGWSVSGAGDVNGDGFGDIVAGAYLYRSLLFFEGWGELRVDGTVLVFHGSPTGIVGTDPLSADARIEGNQISSFLGFSVSGAGDVNGDGFDDIIVGVPREGIPFLSNISPNDRQGTGGAALVFLGSATGVTGTGFSDADTALLPYPPGFPALNGSGMGSSVSGAGDVNGDGFADVIVGAPGWSDGVNIGAAVVFLGSSTGLIGSDPASAHARLSSDPTTPMGADVAAAGDVNGDGFGDIIVGAPGFNGSGLSSNSMGAFMVFHGSTQGISATGPAGAQARFEGIMGGHQLGREVAAAGDIDGDGFDDVIVAALGYAGGLDQEGAAYVFRGSPAGIVGTSLRDDAYVRLESQQSRAAVNTVDLALSAAGVGDINGDGFADVMLGTGFYDAGEENEGAAFIYLGGSAPITPNRPPMPNAGADINVFDIDNNGSEIITLDGSVSIDPDGVIVSYAWLEGETLLGTNPLLTTSFSTIGLHTLVLTATDDGGVTRGDPVNVVVNQVATPLVGFDDFSSGGFAGGIGWSGNWVISGDVSLSSVDPFPTAPQAVVGAGATLSRSATLPAGATGMMLDFDAKASQFALTDQVAVQVSHDGGSFTTIKTFTVTDSDDSYHFLGGNVGGGRITLSWYPSTAATLELRFVSTATTGLLFIDDIRVRALLAPAGQPLSSVLELPVANAGVDITVDDNDGNGFVQVALNGSQSFDPDGSIVSYQWFETTSAGTSLLGTGTTLSVSLVVGSHNVQLIVTDNDGGSSADTVVITIEAVTPDSDGDGVSDNVDNCTLVANANQRDTDGDGYGNICDADLVNTDGLNIVNLSDFSQFRSAFGTADPDADFDGNGSVNLSDFSIFRSYFGSAPGPSCCVP